MMKKFDLEQRLSIDDNSKHWLSELWKYSFRNCTFPTYREMRELTVPKTTAAYNPQKIDTRCFLNNNQVEISLLSILIVDPTNVIFDYGIRLIGLVRQQMLDDADKIEFDLKVLASTLQVNYHHLRLSFHLFNNFFRMSSGSSSSISDKMIGMEYFEVKSDSAKDFYFHFTSLEESIEQKLNNMFDEEKRQQLSKELSKVDFYRSSNFIDNSRLTELIQIKSALYDLSKLIQLCKEIEYSFSEGNYYATALLLRAAIDHIPPIFSVENFNGVVNNYSSPGNAKSFKKNMHHLNESLRSIGDGHIHSQVRSKEVLPNATQVNFSHDFDLLLSEIVRILK